MFGKVDSGYTSWRTNMLNEATKAKGWKIWPYLCFAVLRFICVQALLGSNLPKVKMGVNLNFALCLRYHTTILDTLIKIKEMTFLVSSFFSRD